MQNRNFHWLFVLLLLVTGKLWAQESPGSEKYWIFFTDKGDISAYTPADILTPRALERRAKHGIALEMNDYPINPAYWSALAASGATLRHPSRWFNAASAWMDAETRSKVEALPFVREVKAIAKVTLDMDAVDPAPTRYGYNAGFTSLQLDMIGLDQMHQNGYNGRGILISVMDNGFRDIDTNPYLSHLFDNNQIVATHDFVNDEENVMDQGTHGAAVLTILAGWGEDGNSTDFNFYGSAHGANYILCHTESDASETHQEEDNWVAAMEFADSLGADIFSTSLGYRDFDNNDDYGYQGMDGNTTIITIGADLAASKGIVVVNSAGNSGISKLLAPADGDSVIAVGAVDSLGEIAAFSSHGPSYDLRVKPDICAMGRATAYVNASGQLTRGNGTSFSCPVMSGFLACMLQAAPETKNMDLYQALIESGDRYDNPDDQYGYGIPAADRVYLALTGEKLPNISNNELVEDNGFAVFPNPATNAFSLMVDNETLGNDAILEMFDAQGRRVMQREIYLPPFYSVFHFERETDFPGIAAGNYVLKVRGPGKTGISYYWGRIALQNER